MDDCPTTATKDTSTAIRFSRVNAAPNRETFKIKPIAELIARYVGDGAGWVDPFAGDNSPAEYTNDHNPATSAKYHLDAVEFCETIIAPENGFNGVVFDPPYSHRQTSEHYKVMGKKATRYDTSNQFFNRVMNPIWRKVRPGGFAISCGWNSNGFGKNRGFYPVEILLVAHGQHHYDTFVTVEKRQTDPVKITLLNDEIEKHDIIILVEQKPGAP